MTSDEVAIRKLIEDVALAFRAKNLDKLMTFYEHSDALVVFDVVPPRQYTGWEAYRKDLQRMFDGFDGPIGFDVSDISVATDGTLAYSHCADHVTGTTKQGTKVDHTVRVTDVYRKHGDTWRIAHEHISVPVDMATGKPDLHAKS